MSYTLESIAKLSGVSRGTVSRVINNQPGVKPAVRERVLGVIAETGYVPNPQARSLAGGRTENIGVVVFGNSPLFLSHHLFFEVLQGIQSHSTLNAYDLVLFSNRSDRDAEYWKRIGDKRKVDGLIIMG
ncbi:MAG: transcriptional regulator, LacI family, partial [Paenibacillus sp.]|nr:transcriptional regulator, LacI family [Paenibacillus sp.]